MSDETTLMATEQHAEIRRQLEATIDRLTQERDEANAARHVHLEELRDTQRRLENALSDFALAHSQGNQHVTDIRRYLNEITVLNNTVDQQRGALRALEAERDDLLTKYRDAVDDYAASVSQADRYHDALKALARVFVEDL